MYQRQRVSSSSNILSLFIGLVTTFLIAIFILIMTTNLAQSAPKKSVKEALGITDKEEISVIYKDIVVVQRKAKVKKGSVLFNPSLTLDFSDGPQTLYGLNMNVGYAFSEFWEVYLQTTPVFISSDRNIVEVLQEQAFNLTVAEPQFQVGIEVLWLPAYGKDSWGPYSIVRSDTFLKLGVATLQTKIVEKTKTASPAAEASSSSTRLTLAIGKTFFLSKLWNLRLTAGASVLESLLVVDNNNQKKEQQIMAILDLGLVYYF